MTTILYHANCADGIFAAYYAHLHNLTADLVPVYYQTSIPSLDGHDVICVDYCPDRATLESAKYKSLKILDHHKSSRIKMEGFVPSYPFEYVYDVDKCGAMLTWEYYNPTLEAPWILPYIQDRDLWKWELPRSKEIDACIQSYAFSMANCEMLTKLGHTLCTSQGLSILRYQEKLIQKAVSQATEIEFEGHKVPMVNSTVLQSEIGGELAKGKPFAIVWWNKDKEKRFCYSLRSDPNGMDVSEICTRFGGGGHKHAGSFSCPWHMESDEKPSNI
jgi:oligoribonuclease NrnB/cAMP/cGMP phosphodiesterase (DHH superfamily)